MPRVTVQCDRCGMMVDGYADDHATAGFYQVREGSLWARYARLGEQYLCDTCVYEDPRYIRDYGAHPFLPEVGP